MTARDAATALAATTTSDWVGAGIAIAVALLIAFVLDRIFAWRGRQIAKAVAGGREVTPAIATRLRFTRRLLYAVIILLGVAIALSNFDGVNQIARSLLASGAIAAAILGFAARQTLANFVAGVMLAVTQPLRVGDWVYVEDQYGVVDDIRLTYTYLHTLGGQTVVIPNEKLASGILRNDTLGEGVVGIEVWIWLPPGGRRRARRPVAPGGDRARGHGGRDAPGGRPARGVRRALPAARAVGARGRAAAALPRPAAGRRAAPRRGVGDRRAPSNPSGASYNHVSRCPTPSAPGAGAAAAERRAASSSSP